MTIKSGFLLFLGVLLSFNKVFCQIPIDPSFNASQVAPSPDKVTVLTMAVQPDGKIVFGGQFFYGSSTDATGPSFGRLMPDGSWDATFQNVVGYTANTGFHGGGNGPIERLSAVSEGYFGPAAVRDLAILPDGKIIVVGDFYQYNLNSALSIARLNADGTMDSFGSRGGFSNEDEDKTSGHGIKSIVIQADGKMVIAGDFTSTGDLSLNLGYIARLDANGNIDPTYYNFGNATNKGFNNGVNDLEIQADGKVLAGGRFSTFRSATCGPLARINSDYSIDMAFYTAQGTGFGASEIKRIVIQPDQKIIVAGTFTSFNGTPKAGILRLNSDGSLDPSFDPGSGASGSINALAIQGDGKLLIGGQFSTFNGFARSGIVRLNSDGTVDTTFDPVAGFGARPVDGALGIYTLAIQSDEKILAGGAIGSYNGTIRTNIARLFKEDITFPVKLISFEASVKEQHVKLTWKTTFETNSENFGVERSKEGKVWELIGNIKASGESEETKTYFFTDESPFNGNNLYRLKMRDKDQSFTYSSIKSLNFEGSESIFVFPNPATDRLFLKSKAAKQMQNIAIYDHAGRLVSEFSIVPVMGIDTRNLQVGTYTLKIKYKHGPSESHSFLVMH